MQHERTSWQGTPHVHKVKLECMQCHLVVLPWCVYGQAWHHLVLQYVVIRVLTSRTCMTALVKWSTVHHHTMLVQLVTLPCVVNTCDVAQQHGFDGPTHSGHLKTLRAFTIANSSQRLRHCRKCSSVPRRTLNMTTMIICPRHSL